MENFIKKDEPVFNQFIDFEDEAVLLFDADGDGDLDLFIGPGGNDNPPYSRQMQIRLFKNDGKGNFTIRCIRFSKQRNEYIGCKQLMILIMMAILIFLLAA